MAAIHIHSSASLPAVESGLIILRISHYTLLEAVISQLHHRIHAFTTLADNPWLLPAARIQTHVYHLRSSTVTEMLSDKWRAREEDGYLPVGSVYVNGKHLQASKASFWSSIQKLFPLNTHFEEEF